MATNTLRSMRNTGRQRALDVVGCGAAGDVEVSVGTGAPCVIQISAAGGVPSLIRWATLSESAHGSRECMIRPRRRARRSGSRLRRFRPDIPQGVAPTRVGSGSRAARATPLVRRPAERRVDLDQTGPVGDDCRLAARNRVDRLCKVVPIPTRAPFTLPCLRLILFRHQSARRGITPRQGCRTSPRGPRRSQP
jgi:hypothetical protein